MAETAVNTRGRLTKSQILRARLTALAHQLGPEAKLPTVLELRDQLCVSVATLNSALSDLEAQNVIYRRHGVGIYVSPQLNQRVIALIIDPRFFRDGSPFWDLLVENARARAAVKEETFRFHLSLASGASALPIDEGVVRDIEAGRVHGVLLVGNSPATMDWLNGLQVPHVAFAGPGMYMVGTDGAALLRTAAQALRACGATRMAVIRPYPESNDPLVAAQEEERTRADLSNIGIEPYRLALGVPDLDPSLWATLSKHEQGYRAALTLFDTSADNRPDALLSTDDMLAAGALPALQRLGLNPGRDLHVATHANRGSHVLLGHEDHLIRLEVDPAEIVRTMFDTLETVMDGGRPAQSVFALEPRLIAPE